MASSIRGITDAVDARSEISGRDDRPANRLPEIEKPFVRVPEPSLFACRQGYSPVMPRIRADSIAAHKVLTRRDILDAAYELISETGTADISLAEVALVVGIGRTTLYEYFRHKDDLIATLVEDRLPEVVSDMLGDVGTEVAIPDKLQRLAERTVEFVVADPVLGVILHRELPRLSAEAQARIRTSHRELAGAMTRLYRDGVESGLFRPMAADLAGRLINDTMMAAAKVLIDAANPRERLDEVLESMGTFLVAGLTSPVDG